MNAGKKIPRSLLMSIITAQLLIACTNNVQQAGNQPVKDSVASVTKPPGSYQDSILIRERSAVFYEPDSLQKEKIRAVTEKGIFESTMHEYYYQVRNAHIVMKKQWKDVKILDVHHVRYLVFIKGSGERVVIDLDRMNDAYGMFVFDTRQSPRLIDMTNVENQLPDYFNN